MKNIQTFKEYSEHLRYHIDNNLDLTESVFRWGSDAHVNLLNETKIYWDANNIILNDKEEWMLKNLKVGDDAIYKSESVKLDIPKRGGNKKFVVYRDSGKKDDSGRIIAKKIEFGDSSGLSIKNSDPKAAKSFWARHKCDSEDKMNPDKPGFWSCYAPSLFASSLDLSSDQPW